MPVRIPGLCDRDSDRAHIIETGAVARFVSRRRKTIDAERRDFLEVVDARYQARGRATAMASTWIEGSTNGHGLMV
jgi:hypothetical protein